MPAWAPVHARREEQARSLPRKCGTGRVSASRVRVRCAARARESSFGARMSFRDIYDGGALGRAVIRLHAPMLRACGKRSRVTLCLLRACVMRAKGVKEGSVRVRVRV
eukprot:4719958-Pleurochrysis_carterae.AAC.2